MSAPSRTSILGPADIPADVPQADTESIAQGQGIDKSFLSKARDTLLGGFGFGTPTTDPELLARQAENERIARTQFSDNIVQRYGDVLGTRDRGFRDFLRDLAANEISGDRTKAQQVAAQVRDSLQKGLQRDLERDRAAREEALGNFAGFTSMLKEAPSIPKHVRKAWVMEKSRLHGIELTKDVAAVIAEGGELGELLQDPAVLDMVTDDPEAALALLQRAGASLPAAMEMIKGLQETAQAQADKAKTTSETAKNVAKARTERATFHQVQANAKIAREKAKDLRKRRKEGGKITGPASVQGGTEGNDLLEQALRGETPSPRQTNNPALNQSRTRTFGNTFGNTFTVDN